MVKLFLLSYTWAQNNVQVLYCIVLVDLAQYYTRILGNVHLTVSEKELIGFIVKVVLLIIAWGILECGPGQ